MGLIGQTEVGMGRELQADVCYPKGCNQPNAAHLILPPSQPIPPILKARHQPNVAIRCVSKILEHVVVADGAGAPCSI